LLPDRAHSCDSPTTVSSPAPAARQNSEELHESGTAPYSGTPCVWCLWIALVSRGQTKLHPDCIHFSCSLPDCVYFSCSLPDCIHFSWCIPTASSSAAAARVRLLVITHMQYKV